MQGQGSYYNLYADNFYRNQFHIINRWLAQHNDNSDESSVRNAVSVVNQMRGSGSSLNNENQTSFVALLNEVDDDDSGTSLGFEGVQPLNGQVQNGPPIVQGNGSGALCNMIDLNEAVNEMGAGPSVHPSESGARVQPVNGQVQNWQSIVQGNGSVALPYEIDLNEADTEMGAGPSVHPFEPGANSSNPVSISSGITGYVSEEDDSRRGSSSNGRRVPCKRRAPEGAYRELNPAGSSASDQQARNFEQGDANGLYKHTKANHLGQLGAGLVIDLGTAPARYNTPNRAGTVLQAGFGAATVNHRTSNVAASGREGAPVENQTSNVAGNGLVIGTGAVPGTMHQDLSGAGQEENFQRNVRLGENVNRQDLRDSLSTRNNGNSQVQSPSQTAMFFPYDHFVNPSIPSPVHVAPRIPTFVRDPDLFRTQQLPPGIIMPRARSSSGSSVNVVTRRAIQHQQGNLRNNPRSVMLSPEYQPGNLSHMATNLSSAATAAPSGGGSSSNFRIPSVPTWYHDQNVGQQYSNRLAEMTSRSESRGQGNYFTIFVGDADDEQEMENSDGDGNIIRTHLRPRRSRLMQRAERQAGEYPAIFPAFGRAASPPLRRRGHLLSEVHSALALVRRGGGLRFEDVMVIDHSVLFDGEDDMHEDMRLDIDDMTYEELLALGEEIGNVSTGLSEEAILANLRPRKYRSIKVGSPDNDESCCICQEEYADGEYLGKLECGHYFHVNCIKEWLMQKNQCPICKKTALAGKHRDH